MNAEVELLREAAKKMRERANLVYPQIDWHKLVMAHSGTALDHALSWHPAVALAVADWLDYAADAAEHLAAGGRRPARNGYTTRALAVARTYLGSES